MISAADTCLRPASSWPGGTMQVELTLGERHEVEPGMLEPVAHRDALATAEQQIVDGLFELADVDVDAEIRIAAAGRA